MKNLSKSFMWILMALLIVGLAGFGVASGSGANRTVASVGGSTVTVEEYGRALQQEQRALQGQSGQALPLQQLVSLGLDRAVLSRLVTTAALDNEMQDLGLSIGDETLMRQISQIQAFQDISGSFDREAYAFALQNANLSESEFERDMRLEAARMLAQGAIMTGAEMPETLGKTLTDYIGARRSFTYVPVTAADVVLPAVEPTNAELKAFYTANIAAFTLPETKQLTYVILRPEALLDKVEVDATAMRALYEERVDIYQVPARRLVERLVFPSDTDAQSAMAKLDTGTATFEILVADRGLTLGDVDLGDLPIDALGEAGKAVFDAEVGAVVGPLPSEFGPALFRVNGILDARATSFEEAEAELRDELAADRARRVIEARSEDIDDLLAGGATLEELASEQELELGQIDWNTESTDEIAAYPGFRDAATSVTVDDFPQVAFLQDGSLFAMRLNAVQPPRPEAFETTRTAVVIAYKADQLDQAIRAAAAALTEESVFLAANGARIETGLRRTAYIDETPAELLNDVFEMELGELRVVSDREATVVVRLDEVLAPGESEEMTFLANALTEQLNQSLANELFQAYVGALRAKTPPQINTQAVEAVHAAFN
jgi:peptidyl-prolyl cis-trans isomerase D